MTDRQTDRQTRCAVRSPWAGLDTIHHRSVVLPGGGGRDSRAAQVAIRGLARPARPARLPPVRNPSAVVWPGRGRHGLSPSAPPRPAWPSPDAGSRGHPEQVAGRQSPSARVALPVRARTACHFTASCAYMGTTMATVSTHEGVVQPEAPIESSRQSREVPLWPEGSLAVLGPGRCPLGNTDVQT